MSPSVLNAQATAKHAHLDKKLKGLHAIGNSPHLSDLGRLQRSEQGRAGLSVAFMDMLVTTDHVVQDEQEDIEVCYPAHPPLPTHAHAHTCMHCAVLCFPAAQASPNMTTPSGSCLCII